MIHSAWEGSNGGEEKSKGSVEEDGEKDKAPEEEVVDAVKGLRPDLRRRSHHTGRWSSRGDFHRPRHPGSSEKQGASARRGLTLHDRWLCGGEVKRWGIRVFPQHTAADVSFRNLADALGACSILPRTSSAPWTSSSAPFFF